MPEAAEVTVAANQLDAVASGRVLRSLTITHPRTTRAQPVASFDRFIGERVDRVLRHGKWIVASFVDVRETLGVHLRMSGQLLIQSRDAAPSDRHVHAVFDFGLDDVVWFRDPRTFGEIRMLPSGAPVAPDLFDERVTGSVLASHARRRRVGIKAVLLDQGGAVSGIGSYLADESLHHAGLSPLAPAGEVAVTAWDRVLEAARSVTEASVAVGGVTLPDEGWVDLRGQRGEFASQLRVHGRAACATCGSPTKRATVGGRSARWCPRCQPARRRR
ncbi:Fpg/Nei family DNA glycosylase [Actinospongicola halichondriae]|uniref:Fpg/Nei family DNA glycosylase n=1 Tax=Actinospongicola halichondriae TaxID=3236844 RepID=UPI003D4038A5